MSQLVLRLLGAFEAELNGKPVTFAYGKIKAILAYLSFNLARPIQREKLAGLIWPDQPQETALENLRQAISRLRKSIGDSDASPAWLSVEREKIALNAEASIQVDVDLFRNNLAFCSRHIHRHARTCRICAAHMETACQIYRGEFLEDLSLPESDLFEDWAAGHRARLHEQFLEALGWLENFHFLVGEYPSALAYARRRVDQEPFNDEIFLELMKMLVENGKTDQAIAQFPRYRKELENETGQAPSRRLTDFIDHLHSGEKNPDHVNEPIAMNLPAPLTPLIGRQVELIELEAWMADPARRLITLLGPGGIGKTRLAIAVADKHTRIFADGVIFSSFTEADLASNWLDKISDAANLQGIKAGEPEQKLLKFLNGKDLLLVLDGFEHVMPEKKLVNWLLENEPGLVILTTSRERLNLEGEWVFPMGGLPFPPSERSGEITKYSAVELFLLMACQRDPAFTLTQENREPIGRICRLVDGMPLAIGLASAWARTLPCAEIAQELQNGLDLLVSTEMSTGGQPISMRTAFGQSWNRLSGEEKRVFRQISVFRGGFNRQAAEAVARASLESLANLVDKSFLRGSPEGRYDLHDLLLQYGAEKLTESGEVDQINQRHFDYYANLAEKNEADLRHGADPFQAFFWMVKERSNLQAAYEWAAGGDPPRDEVAAGRLLKCMHEEFHKTGSHDQKMLRTIIRKF
jgi:predicted ATPase/DNA-binding SARP family transcriptional activator